MTIPKIILNMRDIALGQESLKLEEGNTRKLFLDDSFYTNYCFLKVPTIQRLEGHDIIGIAGKIYERNEVIPICTLNFDGNLKKWQVNIIAPGDHNVYALWERFLPHTIIAWKVDGVNH